MKAIAAVHNIHMLLIKRVFSCCETVGYTAKPYRSKLIVKMRAMLQQIPATDRSGAIRPGAINDC